MGYPKQDLHATQGTGKDKFYRLHAKAETAQVIDASESAQEGGASNCDLADDGVGSAADGRGKHSNHHAGVGSGASSCVSSCSRGRGNVRRGGRAMARISGQPAADMAGVVSADSEAAV